MSNPAIFCFGEILLRMSPSLSGEWLRTSQMPVYIGGAELNVARALARWNCPVRYMSALPANYLSTEIIAELNKESVDPSAMIFTGNRIGIYYLPQGTDLKNAGVIYDRKSSSFTELEPGTIDWDKQFQNSDWFHFSAISPALGEKQAKICEEALAAARSRGMKISVDLNYRPKLWQYGKKPSEIMPSLVQYCDIIMGNIWSASSLLDIKLDQELHEFASPASYIWHAEKTCDELRSLFPNAKFIANTFRFDKGDQGIQYYATLDAFGKHFSSVHLHSNDVIDKVGSGDCFMAGLIYGIRNGWDEQRIINFAAGAAVAKLSERGDHTRKSIAEIEILISQYETN